MAGINNYLQELLIGERHESLSDEPAQAEVKRSIEVVLGTEVDKTLVDTEHGFFVLGVHEGSDTQSLDGLDLLELVLVHVEIACPHVLLNLVFQFFLVPQVVVQLREVPAEIDMHDNPRRIRRVVSVLPCHV